MEIIAMLMQRDSRRARAGTPPPPAPLYDLRGALQRRAAVFGPYDGYEAPAAPHGPAQALGALVRRVVAALDLRRAS